LSDGAPSLAELVADPDWYLDRVDARAGEACFVRSDRQRLVSTAFLDGREPFATGDAVRIALSQLAAASEIVSPAAPRRLILHMSFCGSTQVAHLVDATGAAIVLKEPHALVDLADWRRAMREQGLEDPRFLGAFDLAMALLGRRWDSAVPIVMKPSNWANSLIPALLEDPRDLHVATISIGRRSFLRAAFRGGRDRLTYIARVAAHFAGSTGQKQLVNEIIADPDPLDRVALLALFVHWVQARWFAELAAGQAASHAQIDHATIVGDPGLALEDALVALGLEASPTQIEAALRTRGDKHSKFPDRGFSAAGEQSADELVEHHHGARFDRALAWAAGQLPVGQPQGT
jgi:hypothetical protein